MSISTTEFPKFLDNRLFQVIMIIMNKFPKIALLKFYKNKLKNNKDQNLLLRGVIFSKLGFELF